MAAMGFEKARELMVSTQIEGRDVRDPRVLKAMREVPRHLFVPGALRERAYDDMAMPIGEGQTISQPYMVAKMTELLDLKGTERVLEIEARAQGTRQPCSQRLQARSSLSRG